MPSSPTDRALDELATLYESGLEAVLSDDLQRVGPLLDRADALIAELPASAGSDPSPARDAAREAWQKLAGTMSAAMADTKRELRGTRGGLRVARAYGSDRRAPGLRHDSHV